MLDLKISGLDDAVRLAKNLPGNGLYALALALNDTAKDIQQDTIKNLLPDKFILRSRSSRPWYAPGTKYGFNIQFANKSNLTAEMGSQADWLKNQEEGGTKTASGHRVAVPVDIKDNAKDIIASKDKPRRILAKKGFKMMTKKGEGIFERDANGKPQLDYILEPSVQIKARFTFVKTETAKAEAQIDRRFSERWVDVMRKETGLTL